MNTKRFFVCLAALAVTFGNAAMADGIYKWTDEDGNIHYEDRPSGNANVERLLLSYSRTDGSSVQGRIQARRNAQEGRREAKATAREEAETAAEKQSEIDANEKRCERYRAQLAMMTQGRRTRVYRVDEDGERVYLNEAENLQARENVENLITENCTS
jgi:hypothetical protein